MRAGTHRSSSGPEEARITLTLTVDQAYAVKRAVDLANRLKLGQFQELWHYFEAELYQRLKPRTVNSCSTDDGLASTVDSYCENRDRASHLLLTLKLLFGFPAEHGLHGSYGVGSKELTKEDNRLYEVYKVLAKAIFEATRKPTDDKSMDWCVDNDNPYLLNFSGDKKIPCDVHLPDRTISLHEGTK